MLDMRAVPLDGWDVWLGVLFFVVLMAVCNVVGPKAPPVETRHTQRRFHPVAYGIMLLVLLVALGVVR